MKVLLASHLFSPSVGGIEQVSEILAMQLSQMGHSVEVITRTPAHADGPRPYGLHRQPSRAELFRLLRWCDVYLQSNLSLNTLWPALLLRTPTVAVHHTWISRADGAMGWQDYFKLAATTVLHRNLAVSRSLADSIPAECGVAPNPYRDDYFRLRPEIVRDRDLVFVGRLVSSKGADILLEALSLIRAEGLTPTLSFIGSGPEESNLRAEVVNRGLDRFVNFEGSLTGEALGRMLNRHRVLVVPSRWNEPFGLVALEGIASGCAVVASAGGGLPDAIGPCGVSFPNGDAVSLVGQIRKLLSSPHLIDELQRGAEAHLMRHRQKAVAEFYLQEFASILRG